MDFEHYTQTDQKGFPEAITTVAFIFNLTSIGCVIFQLFSFYKFWWGQRKKIFFEKKLIVALAINDLFQAVNNIQHWSHIAQTRGKWLSADASCQVNGFIHILTGWAQIFIITMMCVSLYARIVKNSQFKWPEYPIIGVLFGVSAFIASVSLWGTSFASYTAFPWWCLLRGDVNYAGEIVFVFLPMLLMYVILISLYAGMTYHAMKILRAASAETAGMSEAHVVKKFMSFLVVAFIVYLPTWIYTGCDLFGGMKSGSKGESAIAFIVIMGHGSSGMGNFYVYFYNENLKYHWQVYLSQHSFFSKFVSPPAAAKAPGSASANTAASGGSATATTVSAASGSSSSSGEDNA